MARTRTWRRMLGLALAVVMLLSLTMPALATGAAADDGTVSLEKVDNSVISAGLGLRRPDKLQQEEANLGNVRVSIVLEGKSTIEAGYSTENIADNASAMAYRATLESKQEQMARAISTQALGGAELDVVWNLTLAANIISANVPYQRIEDIKAVPGVVDVVLETRYEPAVVSKGDADPNMATSPAMIGSQIAYDLEYTGAGSRIAIIDTGTDTNHQSFSSDAYEHAIEQVTGKTYAEAEEDLGLLTEAEVARVLGELHISKDTGMPKVTAQDLYLNSKLPFAFNYVDKDLDVDHDKDTQGEHGSHVAGIATANSYIKQGDDYVKALDKVFVQGVAPEAQLLTMKVFGKSGGAYDSDYMVAIEDAIVLNCDSVNLSLGSASAGSRMSAVYQGILESFAKSDTVVVMSAGNSGSWADEIVGLGLPYLYADDVSMHTGGSPGSFTNSFTVASVDNAGYTGNYVQVGEHKFSYSDSSDSGYGNEPMTTLDESADGSGTEYEYIFSIAYDEDGNLMPGIGSEEEIAAIGAENLEGKIFICQRGTLSFYEKANNAAGAGAAGTIIWNNQAGTIGLNLTGYEYTAPCVSITMADGLAILGESTPVPGEDGKPVYYTGKITVASTLGVLPGSAVYPFYTMSSFSSWGVPGDLSLKPEITAPGGSIYSVNGIPASGDAYEQMSGTSMAAPQVTGMVALVAQYLRDTGLPDGISARQLAQSLLMSTSKPMLDNYGYYYPVLQQGSGLANVGAAVTAHSYITVDGQPDGKVKAELGDDPARTGAYSFTFTLHNLTDKAAEYELSADVFTQYLITYRDLELADSSLPFMMDTSTDVLPATTVFTGDGVSTVTEDGETGYIASVAANGSVEITVDITLDDAAKQLFDLYWYYGLNNGMYVEAYVWADELATAEGVEGTSHSIPVLGFYGNWSDASMYDKGSFMEYLYGAETRPPYLPGAIDGYNMNSNYLVANSKTEGDYIFGGNPMAEDIAIDADYYDEMARNALNNTNGDMLASLTFSNIRNAGAALLQVVDANTGEVYFRQQVGSALTAAYYHANSGAWQSISKSLSLNWNGSGLENGTQVLVQLVLAPEYYGVITAPENKDDPYSDVYDWNALLDGDEENGELGYGSTLSFPVTIDNTAPTDISMKRGTTEETKNTLTIEAKDDNYVALIAIYNEDGSRCLAKVDPNIEYVEKEGKLVPYTVQQNKGEGVTVEVDLSGAYGSRFYVAVYDYALNQTTFAFKESFNETDYSGTIMFQDAENHWSIYAENEVDSLVDAQVSFTAAAYVDGYIFGTDEEGNLYVTDAENLDVAKFIVNIGVDFWDMTYNAADGMLYGVAYDASFNNLLCAVDKLTGELEVVMNLAEVGLYDPTTIACDGEGTFYSIDNGNGHLYSYTLDGEEATDLGDLGRRFNDAWTLEYDKADEESEGKLYWAHYVDEPPYFDVTGDGVTDEDDAQYILEYVAGNELDAWETMVVEYLGDINGDGKITTADAQLLLTYINEEPVGHLVEIDPATGESKTVFSLDGAVNALIFPKEQDGEPEWAKAAKYVATVTLDQDELDIVVNESAQLTAYLTPWTLTEANKAVTWTSSDETVATVDANGVVTGVGAGTAEITATSVAKNADGETVTSNACTVTVTTIEYTIKGALQDEDGEAKLYTFDLAKMTKPEYGAVLSGARSIASTSLANDGNVYVADDVDGSYGVHKVDPATGADIAVGAGAGLPLCDIATSTVFAAEDGGDLLNYVYASYLFPMKPLDGLDLYGFNLGSVLARYTGASELVAITSGGEDDPIEDEETGELLAAEWIWAVDNAGYVWWLTLDETEGLYLGNFFPIDFHGATPTFQGYSEANYCSLVESDDGVYLFLTTFNEGYGSNGTSEIYMLSLTIGANGIGFDAKLVGNVGDGVWPATLYAVEANEESGGPEITTSAPIRESVSAMGRHDFGTMDVLKLEEMAVEKTQSVKDDIKEAQPSLSETLKDAAGKLDDTDKPVKEELDLNKGTANPLPVGGSLMSVSYSADKSGESTVGADVTATKSVNGLFEVTYDTDALTLSEDDITANLPEGALYAVNASEGKLILAYASRVELNGAVFHLDFSFDEETAPNYTILTVKTLEENDDSELTDTKDIAVELKEEDNIDPPSDPIQSEPEEPTEPTKPEPTQPDDETPGTTVVTPEVTVSEDGSVSAVVDEKAAEEIVSEAAENGSENVVVKVEATEPVTEVTAELPASLAEGLAENTDADVVIETPVGTVTIPNDTLGELAGDGETITVTVSAEAGEGADFTVTVAKDGKPVENLDGGLKVELPVAEDQQDMNVVAVLVDADGNETIITKSIMTEDGMAMLLDTGAATIKYVNNDKSFEDDIPDWASDAVQFATSRELFLGVDENTFGAGEDMSRYMLATVLYRLEDNPEAGDISFEDVAEGNWYSDAAAWAAEKGIVQGTGDGFNGDDSITREQLAVMLYRYVQTIPGGKGESDSYADRNDADEVSSWAEEAMRWAVGSGIINGDAEGNLNPGDTATRGEVAAMLMRFVAVITG